MTQATYLTKAHLVRGKWATYFESTGDQSNENKIFISGIVMIIRIQ